MGTLKIQRLTDAEIVAEYAAGKSQCWLGLKARLSTAQVRDILVRNGVRVRSSPEALRLSIRARQQRLKRSA